jgi:hypothetical protein
MKSMNSMKGRDVFQALGGGLLVAVSVALTFMALASSSGEIKTQLESYINGKGFFEGDQDLYALVLVPSGSSSSTSITSWGARTRLQTAVETLLPAGTDLVRTAASQVAADLSEATTMPPNERETATVDIFFEQNSTTAASGILVGVETLRDAKALATELSSKLVKGGQLPGHDIRAVRLTAASCDTFHRLYPAHFRLVQSMPETGLLVSTLHEQSFSVHSTDQYNEEQSFLVKSNKDNDKRVRIGTLSIKERYTCTITTTAYRGKL